MYLNSKEPFFTMFDREKLILSNFSDFEERKISDLKGYFLNEAIRQKMEYDNNTIVYKVYKQNVPHEEGELLHCITIIEPGNVDGEFFMTKGHYHVNENCAEIYYGQSGMGLLIMQNGNRVEKIEMNAGTIAYIPAGWGHRTVNIKESEPFVFFSIWPAQSGYNYQKSIDEPFKCRVFRKNNGYELKYFI
ncbi:cupin domain-containing protein [Caloramator sp. E03]|uniref:glucose-6-phosphate isomerase family protein n=1 Tax=Caloramator sp. E03 TaxID=2576307 RepID=UPI00111021E8|nr:glucose-6-phosphate isomerase family protein [Caloramator sp. E03]QCX34029.1 cupin domain-containing protein [Caloramator sp. E03]